MNRDALLEVLDRLDGSSWIARRFLNDPSTPDHMVALELLGRLNIIEAKVAEIRSRMAADHAADSNVHVLDRPSPGDAA